MRKDLDLGKSGEYCQHSRNTALGKEGVNRTKRRRAKSNVPPEDLISAPPKKKGKKKWGIKIGKYCQWYDTEKARNQAYNAAVKENKLAEQAPTEHWWARLRHLSSITKVER